MGQDGERECLEIHLVVFPYLVLKFGNLFWRCFYSYFFLLCGILEIRFGFVLFIGYLWSFMLFPLLYFPSLALILFSLSFSYLLFPLSPSFLFSLLHPHLSDFFTLFYVLISSLLWFSFYSSSLILFSLFFFYFILLPHLTLSFSFLFPHFRHSSLHPIISFPSHFYLPLP